jgi:hypothetical protein
MARIDATRELTNAYDQYVTVDATFDAAQWHEVLVTITHSDPDEPGCAQLAMTVGDAHRLAAALYAVITELEAKVSR